MKKQARGRATAERVLDAALARFVAEGIPGLAVQGIAEASGVSIGSIYHHFGSTGRLLFDLYRRCLESMLAFISAAVLRHRDAEGGIRALVTSYLDFVARHPGESRLIFAVAHTELSDELRPELDELAARVTGPIAAWLYAHVAAGAVVDLPPALYEVVLIGPPAEAARRILTGTRGLSFASAKATLPEAAWRAVAKPKRRPRR